MHKRLILRDAAVFDGVSFIKENCVLLEDGRITSVFHSDHPDRTIKQTSLKGMILCPGLIDLHVHGADGIDAMDVSGIKDLERIFKIYAGSGVTSSLLAVFYDERFKARAATLHKLMAGATRFGRLLGLYLEGPFISLSKRGSIPERYIIPDNAAGAKALDHIITSGVVKIMTVAPERPDSFRIAARAGAKKIMVSFGHSKADYNMTVKALKSGFSHVTHLFNAMEPIHHRQPGPVPAVFRDRSATVELIADGAHIHPEVIRLAYKCMGPERIVLITDSAAAAGRSDGSYNGYYIKNGAVYRDGGMLMGSATPLIQMCRNMKKWLKIKNDDVLRMATSNPARVLGRTDIGIIKPGAKADLTVLDSGLNVSRVYINGKLTYKRQQMPRF
jgi:N-acetylglucosamine-6-phosphate deacetylase